jgi:hypothetical protein
VQSPDVSFDGTRIVFAGTTGPTLYKDRSYARPSYGLYQSRFAMFAWSAPCPAAATRMARRLQRGLSRARRTALLPSGRRSRQPGCRASRADRLTFEITGIAGKRYGGPPPAALSEIEVTGQGALAGLPPQPTLISLPMVR